MDYSDFENKIKSNCDFPAIINLHIGSTFKVIDDLDRVLNILKQNSIKIITYTVMPLFLA